MMFLRDLLAPLAGYGGMLAAGELTPEGTLVIGLLAAAGFLLMIYNQARQAFGRKSWPPGNVQVELARVFADREEVDGKIEALAARIHRERDATSIEVGKVHNRVNDVSTKVDTMNGKLDGLGANVGLLMSHILDGPKAQPLRKR